MAMTQTIRVRRASAKDRFPIIDFAFQNASATTAVVSSFSVVIKTIELDLRPALKFYFSIEGRELSSVMSGDDLRRCKELVLYASNSGWGDALDFSGQVEYPTLQTLFPDTAFMVSARCIPANGRIPILTIDAADIDVPKYVAMRDPKYEEWDRKGRKSFCPGKSFPQEGVAIWSCLGETGATFRGSDQLIIAKDLRIGKGWFGEDQPTFSGCFRADIRYCCLIDVSRGVHERTYEIARKIPPGDVERFFIQIGADRSCKLLVSFRFATDSGIVESDDFLIQIVRKRYEEIPFRDGASIIIRPKRAGAASSSKETPDSIVLKEILPPKSAVSSVKDVKPFYSISGFVPTHEEGTAWRRDVPGENLRIGTPVHNKPAGMPACWKIAED